MSALLTTSSKAAVNLLPRSRMRDRNRVARPGWLPCLGRPLQAGGRRQLKRRVPVTSIAIAIEQFSTEHVRRSVGALSIVIPTSSPDIPNSSPLDDGPIAVARSVGDDDDARRLAQRLHCQFGSSVDVDPRFRG
jgi:hypothetical protein